MRKILFILTVGALFTLSGCSKEKSTVNNEITVYLYDTKMLNDFAPYLTEAVPEVDFKFVASRSEVAYYEFCRQNGELPDIIIVGCLPVREVQELNNSLMDLSKTETTFYKAYLDDYTDSDGMIYWLPGGGVVNGFVANVELFEQYNVKLPEDYAGFREACEKFKEAGILPYLSDYKYDYTCLYTLEGCSIPELVSLEGTSWRLDYESETTDNLDRELWTGAFDKLEAFMKDTGLTEDAITRGYTMTLNDFADGKVAMIRGTAEDLQTYSQYHKCKLLPYFGETEEDNWILLTPAFHVALNRNLENNPEKLKLAEKVLNAMFTPEGYAAYLDGAPTCLIPYNRGVDVDFPDTFSELEDVIAANRMYPLLTSDSLLQASKVSVQKLLAGETDAEGAYENMNTLLKELAGKEEETVATLENGYSVVFQPDGGSPATSVIANTLRKISGTELLLAPSSICTGSLYAADYSQRMLEYAMQSGGNHLYTCEVTGAEVFELARLAVEGYDTCNNPFSDETLPVSSGFSMEVQKKDGTYVLTGITVNGEALQENRRYTLTIADHVNNFRALATAAFGEDGAEQFLGTEKYARTLWAEYIAAGNQPEEPTDYIILK